MHIRLEVRRAFITHFVHIRLEVRGGHLLFTLCTLDWRSHLQEIIIIMNT